METLFIEGLPEQQVVPFATQISNNDQRFTAAVTDAMGRVFVAWHDTNLNVVLCELIAGPRLIYRAGPVPGAKDSCVALCIERDNYVRAFYGARPAGATSGEFPLMTEEMYVPGVLSVSAVLRRQQEEIDAEGGDLSLTARVGALETVYQGLGEEVARIRNLIGTEETGVEGRVQALERRLVKASTALAGGG